MLMSGSTSRMAIGAAIVDPGSGTFRQSLPTAISKLRHLVVAWGALAAGIVAIPHGPCDRVLTP
jgi:hypothetical protein